MCQFAIYELLTFSHLLICICSKLHSILGPYDGKDLTWHAVTKSMSNPSFQEDAAYQEIKKPSIKSFFAPRPGTQPLKESKPTATGALIEKNELEGEMEGAEAEQPLESKPEIKEKEEENEKVSIAPTPNTDEPPEIDSKIKQQPPSEEKHYGAVDSPGGSGTKQKGAGTRTPPSSRKKARPPGQPDIASFFMKK